MTDAVVLDQHVLDMLWDFDDPVLSEQRLHDAREASTSATVAAELATQEARALGLQGRFDEAHALLDEVPHDSSAVVSARWLLERGRLLNSAKQPQQAALRFADALDRARAAGHTFLLIDALHMLAIADPEATEKR